MPTINNPCSSMTKICAPQLTYSAPTGYTPESPCAVNQCTSYTVCTCQVGNKADPNIYTCGTQKAVSTIDKYDWTPVNRGDPILPRHLTELRAIVNAEERVRFQNITIFDNNDCTTGNKITSNQFNQLKLLVNKLLASGSVQTGDAKNPTSVDYNTAIRIANNYDVGMPIKATDINALALQLNWLSRQCYCKDKINCGCQGNYDSCICNTKYSPCGGQCNCKTGYCSCNAVTCSCQTGLCSCNTGLCGNNCADCSHCGSQCSCNTEYNPCPSHCASKSSCSSYSSHPDTCHGFATTCPSYHSDNGCDNQQTTPCSSNCKSHCQCDVKYSLGFPTPCITLFSSPTLPITPCHAKCHCASAREYFDCYNCSKCWSN